MARDQGAVERGIRCEHVLWAAAARLGEGVSGCQGVLAGLGRQRPVRLQELQGLGGQGLCWDSDLGLAQAIARPQSIGLQLVGGGEPQDAAHGEQVAKQQARDKAGLLGSLEADCLQPLHGLCVLNRGCFGWPGAAGHHFSRQFLSRGRSPVIGDRLMHLQLYKQDVLRSKRIHVDCLYIAPVQCKKKGCAGPSHFRASCCCLACVSQLPFPRRLKSSTLSSSHNQNESF